MAYLQRLALHGEGSFKLGLNCLPVYLLLALLSGCSVPPETYGYDGPVADINDTFRALDESKVEFFYVEKIDGTSVHNARDTSLFGNRGFNLIPVSAGRLVPAAKPITLALVGRTQYGLSLRQLTGSAYLVQGTVTVTLEPNQRYSVKGILSESSSTVWLENDATHEQVARIHQ